MFIYHFDKTALYNYFCEVLISSYKQYKEVILRITFTHTLVWLVVINFDNTHFECLFFVCHHTF